MTAPTTSPDYELTRRLIEVFSDDAELQTLLFPDWSVPKQNVLDTRIYSAHTDIRHPDLLTVTPRVIVDARLDSNDWEQQDARLSSPVTVHIHSLVAKDQYHSAILIDTRIRTIISSTYLTSTRIIASELVQSGVQRRFVEKLFDDAWRLVTPYNAQNVGVLV